MASDPDNLEDTVTPSSPCLSECSTSAIVTLPTEILDQIVDGLVVKIGIWKAIRLRLICRSFNAAILGAICTRQVVDIHDPATVRLARDMGPWLKARILLGRIESLRTTDDPAFSVITDVNDALDELTKPTEEARRRQHLMIAEAVAPKYPWQRTYGAKDVRKAGGKVGDNAAKKIAGWGWYHEWMSGGSPTRNAKQRAQEILSGAIVLGDLALVRSLLDARGPEAADVSSKSVYFGRPLALAAAWGHADIVRYLLSRGADPHAGQREHNDGDEHWFSPRSRVEVGLLPFGLRDHAFRDPDWSALAAAALAGHEDIVDLLLEPTCRINPLSVEYAYALAVAAKGGHLSILCALERVLVESTGGSMLRLPGVGRTMLIQAAKFGHQDVVLALLERGVHIDWSADTASHYIHGNALKCAAGAGKADMVRLLLARGACTSRGGLEDPALFEAARGGHEETVDVFLEAESDPCVALYQAASCAQARLVRSLLERYPGILEMEDPESKADPDTEIWSETLGAKLLMLAIIYLNPAVVSVLVEFGVSLSEPVGRDELPSYYAKVESRRWMLEALLAMGAPDTEVDFELGRNFETGGDGYVPEGHGEILIQGGVRVMKRTWEWTGKF